ncbi:MAG: flagellar basal body-associated FliL family protein [Vulcanibacillus sp.]
MFKNKLLNISIIIIITVALLGVVSFFLYQYIFPGNIDNAVEEELTEVTIDIPKISTNLGDSSVIVLELTLTIQTDDPELILEEAHSKTYKIEDEIIIFLKNYSIESFSSVDLINQFKEDLTLGINEIIESGKVVSIDITQLFYQ